MVRLYCRLEVAGSLDNTFALAKRGLLRVRRASTRRPLLNLAMTRTKPMVSRGGIQTAGKVASSILRPAFGGRVVVTPSPGAVLRYPPNHNIFPTARRLAHALPCFLYSQAAPESHGFRPSYTFGERTMEKFSPLRGSATSMAREFLTPGFRWLLVRELGNLCPRQVTSLLDRSETIPGGDVSRTTVAPWRKPMRREISRRVIREYLLSAANSRRGAGTSRWG